ncbi:ATP-dependent helicase [Flaviflexus ciconiae]|uniref:DNA 3'-5' helicase n=1 Tax=Flaviflexus ciconiae TaxID=2496867 RepID=A0A3Q9G5G7_9ACTO|nr:ATP-dependent helicase [Flaviflexus ciconiae]
MGWLSRFEPVRHGLNETKSSPSGSRDEPKRSSYLPHEETLAAVSTPAETTATGTNSSWRESRVPEFPATPISGIQSLMRSLNDQQRRASTTDSRIALVRAGAGTGKTATIIARCAHLISEGVSPNSIQVLTFTRRSAAEIRERVEEILGPRAYGLNASTFHSWAIGLLRNSEELWGYAGWTVIDADDQVSLFREARGRRPRGFPTAGQIMGVYSLARNVGCRLSEAVKIRLDISEEISAELGPIAREYERQKSLGKYLDYDDILDIVGQHLGGSEPLAAWVAQSFNHLLIDEVQDTNPLQWKIIHALAPHVSLYCVGDDAQSIYGFRGADFESIHNFKDALPEADEFSLTVNYRSTQGILDLSNWVLEQSPLDYNKKLVAARTESSTPRIAEFISDNSSADWIAGQIQQSRDQGEALRDNLILARSGWSARSMERALLERGLPYRFYGGQKLLESAHIRDLLATLRITVNPFDKLAWRRFLTLYPGIGPVKAARITEEQTGIYIDTGGFDFYLLRPPVAILLQELLEARQDPSRSVQRAAYHLIPILKDKYASDWTHRRHDFDLLLELSTDHTSVAEFLEQHVIDPLSSTERTGGPDSDYVVLSTIHSSKGMEANNVYLFKAGPGNFPSEQAKTEQEIEEDRRVLYVALTRAKNSLTVTRTAHHYPPPYTRFRTDFTSLPYFLRKVPHSLWDVVHVPEPRNTFNPPSRKRVPAPPSEQNEVIPEDTYDEVPFDDLPHHDIVPDDIPHEDISFDIAPYVDVPFDDLPHHDTVPDNIPHEGISFDIAPHNTVADDIPYDDVPYNDVPKRSPQNQHPEVSSGALPFSAEQLRAFGITDQ